MHRFWRSASWSRPKMVLVIVSGTFCLLISLIERYIKEILNSFWKLYSYGASFKIVFKFLIELNNYAVQVLYKSPIFTDLLDIWRHRKVFHIWPDNLKVSTDIKGKLWSYVNLLGTFGHASKEVKELGKYWFLETSSWGRVA